MKRVSSLGELKSTILACVIDPGVRTGSEVLRENEYFQMVTPVHLRPQTQLRR